MPQVLLDGVTHRCASIRMLSPASPRSATIIIASSTTLSRLSAAAAARPCAVLATSSKRTRTFEWSQSRGAIT